MVRAEWPSELINALRRSQPGCDNCDVSSSQHYADLQPATERIGLTERLGEERRAIFAQARDLSTDLTIGRIVKHLADTDDRWFQATSPSTSAGSCTPDRRDRPHSGHIDLIRDALGRPPI